MPHPFSLQRIPSCDSTNCAVLEYPLGTALWADCQTHGRGRRGHLWQSKKGEGIYFSIFFSHAVDSNLPLLVGVAIFKALTKLGARDIFLKWSNDIFFKEKKIGGVLVEKVRGKNNKCVIGIGLNLKTPQLENADYPVASLLDVFEKMPPAQDIVQAILESFSICLTEGFAKNKAIWEENALWRGKMVRLETETGIFTGIFTGIDSQGALYLANFDKPFFSGSLRCPSSV